MFLGLFLLIASLLIDPIVFGYNLFTEPEKEDYNVEDSKKYTCKGISLFEEALDEVMETLKQTEKAGKEDGDGD